MGINTIGVGLFASYTSPKKTIQPRINEQKNKKAKYQRHSQMKIAISLLLKSNIWHFINIAAVS
jgi:hypothetical protein